MNHFKIVHQDSKISIFSAVVFAKALGRKIKLALVQYLEEDSTKIVSTKLYFSTDLNLPAWYIIKYCKLRFQIEFIYPDANQFTDSEHCSSKK
jgi:hypothetical protein